MKFVSLDLEAYGPFTSRKLPFRAAAHLHLVYGPNEAGKTSALSAIGDLLFGFGNRTSSSFRHPNPALRIGGEVVTRDGRLLKFRRRKASRNTIVDADDNPLDEHLLTPVLGTLDRADFDTEFGLTAAALRKGGEELLKAGGRLAETLAASSAGLLVLSRLKTRLDAEAEAIFTPRKSASKPFYVTLSAYDEAEKGLKASVVTNENLESARRALAAAEASRSDAADAYEDTGRQIEQLKRIRQTFPKLKRLDDARAALHACGALRDIDVVLLESWRSQAEKCRDLSAEIARLEEADQNDHLAISALNVDELLHANSERVRALRDRSTEVRKGRSDLPRRRESYAAVRGRLEVSARHLGFPDIDVLLDREPSAPELARAEEMVELRRTISIRADEARERLARLQEDIERFREQADAGSYLADPGEMKRQFDALRRLPVDAEGLREASAALKRESQSLAEEAARLHPPISAEALAHMPLPSPEDIAAAVNEAGSLALEIKRLSAEAVAAARATKMAEEAMHGFTRAAASASPESLREERARRDATMDLLAQSMNGPAEVRSAHFADLRTTTRAADAIADMLLDSARTIAQAQAAARTLAEKQQAERDIAETLENCRGQRDQFEMRWRTLWQPCGIEPGEPALMQRWRDAAENILKRREALGAQAQKQQILEARLAASRPALETLAKTAGVARPEEEPVEHLYELVRNKLEDLQKIWNQGRERAGALQRTGQELRKAKMECEAAETRMAAIVESWPEDIACLGLDRQASVQQAAAALKIWQSVPGDRAAMQLLERQIDGIQRDEEAYTLATHELTIAFAPDLAGAQPDAAVAALQTRLDRAVKMQGEKEARLGVMEARRLQRGSCIAKAASLKSALQSAFALLEATDEEDLLGAIRRHIDRKSKAEEVENVRRDLRETAPGHDEVDLRAELEGFDYDTLPARIAALESSLAAQRTELDKSVEQIISSKHALETLSQTSRAAAFAQASATAQGELREIAANWLIRAAAAGMARIAIERQREKIQIPMLGEASRLFRVATAGAFSGLAAGFGDDEQPTLSAQRAGGEKVSVTVLSEGTRDQLFLALRLALLTTRAGEPLPFVADDLLASFDDERAASTLNLLAEFGAGTQTILFTHHRHIVEIARARLGERLDLIELTG